MVHLFKLWSKATVTNNCDTKMQMRKTQVNLSPECSYLIVKKKYKGAVSGVQGPFWKKYKMTNIGFPEDNVSLTSFALLWQVQRVGWSKSEEDGKLSPVIPARPCDWFFAPNLTGQLKKSECKLCIPVPWIRSMIGSNIESYHESDLRLHFSLFPEKIVSNSKFCALNWIFGSFNNFLYYIFNQCKWRHLVATEINFQLFS